jgi:hypothetical protein
LLGKRQITTIVASSSAKSHFEHIEVDMVVSKNNAVFKAKLEGEKHVSRSESVGRGMGGDAEREKKKTPCGFLTLRTISET